MEQIRKQIQLGNLQLAKLNDKQQPVPMSMSELEQKQQRINKQSLILQQIKNLSDEQRFQWVNTKKRQANRLYKQGKYGEAISIYLEALLGIQISEKDQKRLKIINIKSKFPIILNIATCLYQKMEYERALTLCNRIISQNYGNNYIKAFYKKAHCLISLGQFQQAKETIKKMSQLIEQENDQENDQTKITALDLAKLLSDLRKKSNDQRKIYRNFFTENNNQQDQLINNNPTDIHNSERMLKRSNEKQKHCCKKIYEIITSCLMEFQSKKQNKQI